MQPPHGQGYGAQQPGGYGSQQPGGYGPQTGGPQYGMSPPPGYGAYGMPQKKGMPGWAWVLIICGVVFIGLPMILGILAVIMMPAITSNTRDARRAEGEQLMGMARDFTRVAYSKTGDANQAFQIFEVDRSKGLFDGTYFNVDSVGHSTGAFDARVTCVPTQSVSDGHGSMEFRWTDGSNQIRWE